MSLRVFTATDVKMEHRLKKKRGSEKVHGDAAVTRGGRSICAECENEYFRAKKSVFVSRDEKRVI